MSKTLKFSAISGFISLGLSVPLIIFASLSALDPNKNSYGWLQMLTILASLVFYLIFIYGFKLIANKNNIKLLSVSSIICMVAAIIYYCLLSIDILSPQNVTLDLLIVLGALFFGIIDIPFGIGVMKLNEEFGGLAKATGIISIITGALMATFILSIFATMLIPVVYILSSILLLRASKKYLD